MLVVVEVSAEPVVGDEQVGPAIVIVVAGADGKILAFGLVDFRFDRDVGESAVTIIVIERVRAAAVSAGRATALHSAQIAVAPVAHVNVAADVQIEPSVTVVIEEGCAGMKRSRFRAGDPGFVGHIGERPIAIVVIKNVAAILGHVQVGKSVVVVIAPDAAQAVAGAGNAGLFGDVGECAVTVITIERIADGDASVIQITAVHEVNVLPAVAVEVGHADSRTKFLAIDGDALVALEVGKCDAGRRRRIRKLD